MWFLPRQPWENRLTDLEGSMSIGLIGILVAVLTVGAALAGLILSSSRGRGKT